MTIRVTTAVATQTAGSPAGPADLALPPTEPIDLTEVTRSVGQSPTPSSTG